MDYYEPDVLSQTDYYPFGMEMPGRQFLAGTGYRYGFNGKENDSEVKGEGNQQDYGMRIYDPRLGRFLSVDPIAKDYPMLTPYQFASNSPIQNIDLDGLEGVKSIDTKNKTITFTININYVEKTKDMDKSDKIRSFSAGDIEKVRKGLTAETQKKGVPRSLHVSVPGKLNKETNQIEGAISDEFTIVWNFNFIKQKNYQSAVNSADPSDGDTYNPNTLLTRAVTRTVESVNPNYDPSNPNSPEFIQTTIAGSSNWRQTQLKTTDSHTALHEIMHNMIHLHKAGTIRISNTDAGHAQAGGIFIYKNEALGTNVQNLSSKNIIEAFRTLPTVSGELPSGSIVYPSK